MPMWARIQWWLPYLVLTVAPRWVMFFFFFFFVLFFHFLHFLIRPFFISALVFYLFFVQYLISMVSQRNES